MYLGRSLCHAGNMILVLNPRTLHVCPQFHVVFDDEFTTVPSLRSRYNPTNWTSLVQSCTQSLTDEAYDLYTSLIENTDDHPTGGPSNDENIIAPRLNDSVNTRPMSNLQHIYIVINEATISASDEDTPTGSEEEKNDTEGRRSATEKITESTLFDEDMDNIQRP